MLVLDPSLLTLAEKGEGGVDLMHALSVLQSIMSLDDFAKYQGMVAVDRIWRQVITLRWMTSFQKRTHLEPTDECVIQKTRRRDNWSVHVDSCAETKTEEDSRTGIG